MNSNNKNTNDRVDKKEGNDSQKIPPHNCSLPTPWLQERNPFLLRRDALPLAPGNDVRWYRITSYSWPCRLLATVKINPVVAGIRTLGKCNVSNRRHPVLMLTLSCYPSAMEGNTTTQVFFLFIPRLDLLFLFIKCVCYVSGMSSDMVKNIVSCEEQHNLLV